MSRAKWPATWLDDGFPDDPKVAGLTDRAFRFHVTALVHCNQNLTDGHVSTRAAKIIAVKCDTTPKKWTEELVAAGLWRLDDTEGFWINNYLEYNLSEAEVRAMRKSKSDSGKRGAAARWGSKDDADSDSSRDGSRYSETDGEPMALYPVLDLALGALAPSPTSYVGHESHDSNNQSPAFARLHLAVGPTDENLTKLKNAARGCAEGAIVAALDACQGPGVRDRLAVALAELKKRRAA